MTQPITMNKAQFADRCTRGRVVIIDDDPEILAALGALIQFEGYAYETYRCALDYLHALNDNRPIFSGPCCVLCDVKMPEIDGLELQSRLAALDDTPLLLMSGASGAQEAACAFRAGALDFLVKPIDADTLLTAIEKAIAMSQQRQQQRVNQTELAHRMASLTPREREIARRAATGQTNPAIASELGIALRTVKLHRQRAMEKLGASGTADLVRIADKGGL